MDPMDEVNTVVQALRRYTSDNPQACDTPDGIARWWLQGGHALPLVERALERLLQQGQIQRMPATDGRVRYRRPDTAATASRAAGAPLAGATPSAPRSSR